MSLHIIESLLVGKRGSDELCEDAIVTTPSHVAVIDGATDKYDRRFNGKFGGRFASDVVTTVFETLRPEATLAESVHTMSERLRSELAGIRSDFDIETDDGPSAVFVAYSVSRREVWRVGDCSWRTAAHVEAGHKQIDEIAAAARVALLRSLQLSQKPLDVLLRTDPGREMILPLLRAQSRFRNRSGDCDLAYGAIDGRPVPPRFLEIWSLAAGAELVLATDGYPEVLETLVLSEERLEAVLRNDPLMLDAAGTKGVVPDAVSYDDRAYLRLVT